MAGLGFSELLVISDWHITRWLLELVGGGAGCATALGGVFLIGGLVVGLLLLGAVYGLYKSLFPTTLVEPETKEGKQLADAGCSRAKAASESEPLSAAGCAQAGPSAYRARRVPCRREGLTLTEVQRLRSETSWGGGTEATCGGSAGPGDRDPGGAERTGGRGDPERTRAGQGAAVPHLC